jgi:hypothetical protein
MVLLVGIIILLEETSVRANQLALRVQRVKHIARYKQYRERYKGQNQQPPIVIIQGTPHPLHLIGSARGRTVCRDARGVIFEKDAGEESDPGFYAVTADFHNAISAKRKTSEAMDVSARVVFHPFDESTNGYVTLERGAWLRVPSGKVPLGRNDTRELVIATVEGEHVYAIKQLDVVNGQKVTTRVNLPNGSFDVHVRLTAELENRSVHRAHLVLEQTGDSATPIRLTPANQWRATRIGELNEIAYALINRALVFDKAALEPPTPEHTELGEQIKGEFVEWQNTVAAFLLKRWDKEHKLKFLPEPIKRVTDSPAWAAYLRPRPLSFSKVDMLSDDILAKLKILEGFQRELSAEILKEFTG